MKFAQVISVRCEHPEKLVRLLEEWDHLQAAADVMGYIGNRLMADRDEPGHYLIMAEFAQVEDELSPAEEAEMNNLREETKRWAEQLRVLVEAEPEWHHFDEIYWTGLTGDLRTG